MQGTVSLTITLQAKISCQENQEHSLCIWHWEWLMNDKFIWKVCHYVTQSIAYITILNVRNLLVKNKYNNEIWQYYPLFSLWNENLNWLVRIKFLNLFLYSSKHKNWKFLVVRTKFYWSWAGGPVFIVKTLLWPMILLDKHILYINVVVQCLYHVSYVGNQLHHYPTRNKLIWVWG